MALRDRLTGIHDQLAANDALKSQQEDEERETQIKIEITEAQAQRNRLAEALTQFGSDRSAAQGERQTFAKASTLPN